MFVATASIRPRMSLILAAVLLLLSNVSAIGQASADVTVTPAGTGEMKPGRPRADIPC